MTDIQPTHRCKICGSLWKKWSDDELSIGSPSWSLISTSCGQCCRYGGVALGQIERLNPGVDKNHDIMPLLRTIYGLMTNIADEIEQLRNEFARFEQLSAYWELPKPEDSGSYQSRVAPWMQACFGAEISADRMERNHRFLEEALELVQACGATAHEAHQLVDYTFGRPIGEPHQEVGGVMVTLAALCLAQELNMHHAGEDELARIWTKIEKIREKQAAKPKYSPLPGAES